jgi:hypothetical protein
MICMASCVGFTFQVASTTNVNNYMDYMQVCHLTESAEDLVVFHTDHSGIVAISCPLRTVATEKLNLRLVSGAICIQTFEDKVDLPSTAPMPGRTTIQPQSIYGV